MKEGTIRPVCNTGLSGNFGTGFPVQVGDLFLACPIQMLIFWPWLRNRLARRGIRA